MRGPQWKDLDPPFLLGKGTRVRSTSQAVLVKLDPDGTEVWVPLSQYEGDVHEDGLYGKIYITAWLARARGYL